MATNFKDAFNKYPAPMAPFLHEQWRIWQETKPLKNLRIAHHVPVVENALLKIACLVAAGADVTLTNPDFMNPCTQTLAALQNENVRFVADRQTLKNETFDIYLDCGAALYTTLGAPKIGAIELTGTGDHAYRQLSPSCPVISIDKSLTKQLETVFGAAYSAAQAITMLTSAPMKNSKWVVFGFGKIGRGLAYLCLNNGYDITIIDTNHDARMQAQQLGIIVVDAKDIAAVQLALKNADIVMTATGGYDVLTAYQKSWFDGKILASMGILDEFGPRFSCDEILYEKMPINFSLNDPTPIEYIDPELYLHNQATLDLLTKKLANGVHNLPTDTDENIIERWCRHHLKSRTDIDRWFIQFHQA